MRTTSACSTKMTMTFILMECHSDRPFLISACTIVNCFAVPSRFKPGLRWLMPVHDNLWFVFLLPSFPSHIESCQFSAKILLKYVRFFFCGCQQVPFYLSFAYSQLFMVLIFVEYFDSYNEHYVTVLRAPCGLRELWFFVRIGPIRFLAGCRKRRLNQG